MPDENGKWPGLLLGEKGIGLAPYLTHFPPQTVINGGTLF